MHNVVLEVLDTDPAAVEAMARTIESMVPGRHLVLRDGAGLPELVDGSLLVRSSDPGFVVWAAPCQGYVLSAREVLIVR